MTWKDIKLATLQKMFSAEGSTIPSDETTNDYIASMPHVANEALQRLSTAGKFIVKRVSIAHNPLKNLLDDITLLQIGTHTASADKAHAYYFEFTGKGTLTITVGSTTTTVNLLSKGSYTSYRGIIENPDNEVVVLEFSATYPSAIKSLALYAEIFDDDTEIPEYAKEVRYNLKDLVEDFYQLGENQIFYEGTTSVYLQISDYFREGDSVLILDRGNPGNYTVYYRAYPPTITLGTEDDYELPLDREVAVLLPLYMASELYKDDDVSVSTQYRNEFEIALESLIDSSFSVGKQEFVSESGWI